MSRSPSQYSEKRRLLLRSMAVGSSLAVAGGLREVLAQGVAPGVITRDAIRPQVPYGVMSGDVTAIARLCGARLIGRRGW